MSGQKIFAIPVWTPIALDYSLQSDFARVGYDANLTENNMRFSILKIISASVVLFLGCQTSLMAEVNATGQTADEQPAAQSTARAPAATIPPQPAWRGYYPHRPYDRPYRRRGSGSGFGFGSGSGPSFGSSRGPGWDDWGRDPFFDDPWRRSGSDSGFGFGSGSGPSWGSRSGPGWGRDDWGRDPWRRNRSDSGFGFGSGSGPSWGSGSGPRFYDRGRGPRDWDSGGMGFGW